MNLFKSVHHKKSSYLESTNAHFVLSPVSASHYIFEHVFFFVQVKWQVDSVSV